MFQLVLKKIAERLTAALLTDVGKRWFDSYTEEQLYEVVDGVRKYLGEPSGEAQTLAAVNRAKASSDPREIVRAVEEMVLNFCGFQNIKTKCIANAVHFQFGINRQRVLSTPPTALSVAEGPSDADKALSDDAEVVSAEL